MKKTHDVRNQYYLARAESGSDRDAVEATNNAVIQVEADPSTKGRGLP